MLNRITEGQDREYVKLTCNAISCLWLQSKYVAKLPIGQNNKIKQKKSLAFLEIKIIYEKNYFPNT